MIPAERREWLGSKSPRELIRHVRSVDPMTECKAAMFASNLALASQLELALDKIEILQGSVDSIVPPIVAEACTAVTDAELAVIAEAREPRNGFLSRARWYEPAATGATNCPGECP
jgi:hypothetical protein